MSTPQSYEQVREGLEHDRLKNEFLMTMGYYPASVGHPKRGDVMRCALRGDADSWQRLERGCELWSKLTLDIGNFLRTLPVRYGFVFSEQYRLERTQAEMAMGELGLICEAICTRRFSDPDIDRFWAAADTVRELLRAMAKNNRFREFVLDIDPQLIKERENV